MSTVTVGASGAAGTFDYTCDGSSDHVQILAAIGDCGAGDTVALSSGTFVCGLNMLLAAGVSLVGTGATVVQYPATPTDKFSIRAAGANTVSGIEFTGSVRVLAQGSDILFSDLVSRAIGPVACAFGINSPSGLVERVRFEDCAAIDTTGFGFKAYSYPLDETSLELRDITLERCAASGCGSVTGGLGDYIGGYALNESDAETNSIENVTLIDCVAEGCWRDGFHLEADGIVTNFQMLRCRALNNAVGPAIADHGAGFTIAPECYLTDCVAVGNADGFRVVQSYADRCSLPVRLVRCNATDPIGSAFVVHSDHGRVLSAVQLDECTADGVTAPNYSVRLTDVQNARIANFRQIDCTGEYLEEYDHVAGDIADANNTITYYLAPFRASIAAPVTGEAVAFTETSDNDGLTAWSWDFGDGSGSAAQHPTHAYPSAGVYPVALTSGGNTVSGTVTVVPGVSYGGARLSEADLAPLDHDPVANATRTKVGSVGLQGSPVSRRTWTINALAGDHAEIEALAALTGQHLVLNINGVEYPGVMIRPPMLETQLTPAAWAYQIGLVQETRR